MKAHATLLLLVIYLGFVSIGLPDGAFGVAWPAIYPELHLPLGLAGTIVTLGTLLAGASAFSSGRVIGRWGTGPVVFASCAVTGAGMLVIAHATGAAWLFAAAVPLGFGAGAVDAGLNGFVARHYAGRHMNWLHACWGIGATCGPLLLGYAIGSGHGWRAGYTLLGTAQLVLAGAFLLTLHWWHRVPELAPARDERGNLRELPTLGANSLAGWLSPLIFALYVAGEMTTGLWASTVLVAGRGFTAESAAVCTASYYGAITGGRILAGFVVEHWGNRRSVTGGIALALAGGAAFALAAHTPATAAVSLVVLGLGFAPIYPCLMHEVPRRFAPAAVQVIIGRQSGAASLGAAVLPALAGWVAQSSLPGVPWLVLLVIGLLAVVVAQLNRLT